MKEYCSTDKLINMVWLILKLMLYTTVYFEVWHLILTYVKLNIKQLLPSREVNIRVCQREGSLVVSPECFIFIKLTNKHIFPFHY